MGKWMAVPGLMLAASVLLAPQGAHALMLAAILGASFALGCLLLTLLQHMVHAQWGVLLIDKFESGGGPWSFAVVALAMLPAWIHPASVYDWAHGTNLGQEWWLSIAFFRWRGVFYLATWAALSAVLHRATRRDSYATDVAAPGFLFVCVTGTFASVDWVMSLEQNFASTVFGMLFLAASALGAMGVCVAMLCAKERSSLFDQPLRRDYGNLLLTMLMLWAYLTFVQYLICWSGNLREEADYFLRRARDGWELLGDGLVGVGFFAPFLLLITPRVRGSRLGLGLVAALIVPVWAGFVIWLAGPPLFAAWWLDVIAIAGVALMVMAGYAHRPEELSRRSVTVHA